MISPAVPVETIFPGAQEEDIRRDIALLTLALNGCRSGDASSRLEDEDRRLLNLYQHVSSLITTGHESDRAASVVNAVTGHILQDRLICAVITHNTKSTGGMSPFLSIDLIKPEDYAIAQKLVDNAINATYVSYVFCADNKFSDGVCNIGPYPSTSILETLSLFSHISLRIRLYTPQVTSWPILCVLSYAARTSSYVHA